MSLRHSRTLVLAALSLFTTACLPGGKRAYTPSMNATPALRIYDTKANQFITFPQFASAIASRDLVFFGEQHNDPATHSAEHAVLAALGERRSNVVVTLEMFERDVQPLLDQYLAGTISEENFLAGARPWDKYATDYRPMVELARVRGWPVIAANVPRRLASAVSRRGLAVLDTMNARDRAYMAREHSCPKDSYYAKFAETMKGHGAGGGPPTAADQAAMLQMTDRFYEAQCAKDEAMGEAIADAFKRSPKGTVIFQVDGAFHSDNGLGTVERALRRVPNATSVVLTAIPVADLSKAKGEEHRDKGDFVLFTRAPK
ncbi:ChaN family lipoprotein [Gemmatimonas phototrophica]|uniref:ChaN family lipoprotein n=1 Tax=Gemmatimonas phototrophica TaxID=1379270 RepID=UPI0009EE0F4B|nr:ChaN family lipoprotein [Gemmatimonas phototrophica]